MRASVGHRNLIALTAGLLTATAMVASASAQEKGVWRHGIIEAKSDSGLIYMASKRGFAEKEGVKLEILPIKSDAIGLKALLAGELDSFEGAPGGALAAAARGADVKIVGCAWPQLVHGIFVNASINKAEDLKGKTFAISAPGAMPELLARAALEQHGLASTDVQFANLGSDLDRYKALSAGVVQGAVVSTEYLPLANKDIKMLFAARDVMPNFVRGCVMTTAKTLSSRQDDAVKFVTAEIKALRYAVTHKDEAVSLTREITEAKADDPRPGFIFDEVVKHGDVDPDMKIPADKLSWLQDLLVKVGNINTPIEISKVIDPSIRTKALANVGK
jgi:NitT/TauT family transport system substrate-binding protein